MNSLIVDYARIAFLPLCVSVSLWFTPVGERPKNVYKQNPLLRCKTSLLIAASAETARQFAHRGFATPPAEIRQTQETKKPLRGSCRNGFELCEQAACDLAIGNCRESDELFASSNQGAKPFGQ